MAKEGASLAINRAFPNNHLSYAIACAALHYDFCIPSRLVLKGGVEVSGNGNDLFKKTLEAFRAAERFLAEVQSEELATA